jgi:DNA-binding transcriptional MerR regulator
MKFAEESNGSTDLQERNTLQADQPVNVGIRIKKLKTIEPAAANEQIPELVSKAVLEPVEEIHPGTRQNHSTDPGQKLKSGRGRKSIKQISEEADLIQIPEDEILFQKHYYSMGEVADMFRVNQSLLRFWEAEFSILQPKKNKKGDRYFRPIDIKNLHLIYHLLRQRKYTIEGAKDFLKNNAKAELKFETIKKLEEVKRFLLEMRANLR